MAEKNGITFEEQRLAKALNLQTEGIVLYPSAYQRTHTMQEVLTEYADAIHDPSSSKVAVAGRIYAVRDHGNTLFIDLRDESGHMQIFIRKNSLPEGLFAIIKKNLERGDIIGVKGPVFRTKVGEISIWAEEITVLTKSLFTLPEKFHGLINPEKRYRQRYIDLIVNEDVRQTFTVRSRLISNIRRIMTEKGFLEFETPILQPIYGGANARPFTTHHNFLDQTLFLRIAPELYLKRLIVGGFEKIFEIAKNFRNEDIDTSHNPEFTTIELYWAYVDYHAMMQITEEIITETIKSTCDTATLPYKDEIISFERPWRTMSMEEAVRDIGGVDIFSLSMEELTVEGKKIGIESQKLAEATNQRKMMLLYFDALVEEKLIQPTFIYGYPVENSPLAKRDPTREGFVERFELFIAGMELANGFSELNDPVDQLQRFEKQEELRRLGNEEATMNDYDFVTALGYGLPPTGGVGIGIDRLVMLATGHSSIKEILLFPSMKTESSHTEEDDAA
ncbi:MAG: lysine--tRNA ligase [Euryarchaeota archaeon]|nr:lysine--tRNA ligase [Euryarchaeota archaeon]